MAGGRGAGPAQILAAVLFLTGPARGQDRAPEPPATDLPPLPPEATSPRAGQRIPRRLPASLAPGVGLSAAPARAALSRSAPFDRPWVIPAVGRPSLRAADDRRLRPGRGPLADRLPRMGPLRQGPSASSTTTPISPDSLLDPYNQNVLKGDYPIIGQQHLPRRRLTTPDLHARPPDPDPDHAVREHGEPGRVPVLRPPQPVLLHQFFGLSRPVPRRRRLQAGRLAAQGHAGLQRQLPLASANWPWSARTCSTGDQSDPRPSSPSRSASSSEAGRHQPGLRLRLGPGRHRSSSSATSAASSSRHQPRGPDLRHPQRQPRPVQPGLLPPVREGHQQRAEHLPRPRPEHRHRQLLPPGLHLPRLHDARAASTTTTTPDVQVQQEPLPRPARPGRHLPAAQVDVVYLGLAGDGHWAGSTSPTQFYWVLGRDSLNPLANRSQRDQRPDGRDRAVLRPRLDAVPHVVLLCLGRPATSTTATRPASTPSSTTRTSPAASSATSSGRRSRSSASTWCSRQPRARPAFEQDPGPGNFVNPGLLLFNLGLDMDLTPKLKMDQQHQFPLVRLRPTSSSSSSSSGNIAQQHRHRHSSTGFEYRPFLSDTI